MDEILVPPKITTLPENTVVQETMDAEVVFFCSPLICNRPHL